MSRSIIGILFVTLIMGFVVGNTAPAIAGESAIEQAKELKGQRAKVEKLIDRYKQILGVHFFPNISIVTLTQFFTRVNNNPTLKSALLQAKGATVEVWITNNDRIKCHIDNEGDILISVNTPDEQIIKYLLRGEKCN